MKGYLRVNARFGVLGLLNLALFGAAITLNGSIDPGPIRIFSAVVSADPLNAELLRCHNLGPEAVNNPSCEKATRDALLLPRLPQSWER